MASNTQIENLMMVNQDWFASLIEECQAIITEKVFNSRVEILEGKFLLGKRILEERENLKRFGYGKEVIETIATHLKMSGSELYHCLKFAEKFKGDFNLAISQLPCGKNISWFKVCQKMLFTPKDKTIFKEKKCQHLNLKVIVYCKNCKKKVILKDKDSEISKLCRQKL